MRYIIQDIRDVLSLSDNDQINLWSPERISSSDFTFAHIIKKNGTRTFAKITQTQKDKLYNESSAAIIAAKMGYPAIKVITPTTETSSGIAICELEFLDFTHGNSFLPTLASRASIPHKYVPILANIVGPLIGKEIARNIDTSKLSKLDPTYEEANKIFESFQHDYKAILRSSLCKIADVDRSKIEKIFNSVETLLPPLVVDASDSSKYFFCGNDISLNNMFFPKKPEQYNKRKVIFFDWEWAGKTRNQSIAFLVDMRTLIRFRPCTLLQKSFIEALFLHNNVDRERTYKLILGGVITQTAFEVNLNKRFQSPFFGLAIDALQSLESTLNLVTTIYQRYKGP